jgi:hypothetical protein
MGNLLMWLFRNYGKFPREQRFHERRKIIKVKSAENLTSPAPWLAKRRGRAFPLSWAVAFALSAVAVRPDL